MLCIIILPLGAYVVSTYCVRLLEPCISSMCASKGCIHVTPAAYGWVEMVHCKTGLRIPHLGSQNCKPGDAQPARSISPAITFEAVSGSLTIVRHSDCIAGDEEAISWADVGR